jgi:hypothetical protein
MNEDYVIAIIAAMLLAADRTHPQEFQRLSQSGAIARAIELLKAAAD